MSDLTQGILLGVGVGWLGLMINLWVVIWYISRKMKKH